MQIPPINTPTYGPGAAVLPGNLVAVGGRETSDEGASKKIVYMYLPSTKSWTYNGDLPAPLSSTAVIIIITHCMMFRFVHCMVILFISEKNDITTVPFMHTPSAVDKRNS